MIREASIADYEAIERLWLELNELHASIEAEVIRRVDEYMSLDDFRNILEDPLQTILVAVEMDAVCGAAWVMERKHSAGEAIEMPIAFVQEICVANAKRGQGLGEALMGAVEDWARGRNLIRIELNVWANNAGAIGFYEEIGFSYARHELFKPVA